MDYRAAYERLIDRARNRPAPTDYYEVHHILPRSLGGSDEPSNTIELTYREHFVAHWLLVKMHTGIARQKMSMAMWCMGFQSGRRIIASWQFEVIKRNLKAQQLRTRKQRLKFMKEQKLASAKQSASQAIEKWNAEQSATTFLALHRTKKRLEEVKNPPPGKRRRPRKWDEQRIQSRNFRLAAYKASLAQR